MASWFTYLRKELEKWTLCRWRSISERTSATVSSYSRLVRQGAAEYKRALLSDIKKILRRASDRDIEMWKQNKAREKEALVRTRAIVNQLNLHMKTSEVEI